jgi:hypothetical protein
LKSSLGALLVITVLVGACASAPKELIVLPIHGLPPLLTWVAEFTRPTGSTYPGLADSSQYGSISGLAKDPGSDQWLGVIDERTDTRVAWLSFSYSSGSMNVTPTRLMPLRPGPGVEARVATRADLEAVTALPDGTFLMSEEGHLTREGELFQPAMLHVTRDGVVTDVVSYPEDFTLRADHTRGVRDNQGFESLTSMPNGHVMAGLEQPLIQDGPTPTFDRGARGRLIEFAPSRGGGYHPVKQWWYPINKTPHVAGFDTVCNDGENGLVELLALTDTLLLAMERACVTDEPSGGVVSPIQIFAVELSRHEVRKSLVLNLSTIKAKLSPALDRLDNFEGMAFGPTATNGLKTIMLVSDDNFRASQKTSFLLFGIRY